MNRFTLTCAAALLAATTAVAAPAVPAAPPPARTLENAASVLDDLAAIPLKGIPPKLLADAEGVAIFPRVIKVGLVFGGSGGHGVVMTRNRDGTWGDPVFVSLGGASFGFQIGVESTDLVLVFRSRDSLDRVLAGREKLTLGVDASVAAGPVGRGVMAATDPKLEAEILSYSRSRGLFAGVAVKGAVILPDPDTNSAFRKNAGPVEWTAVAELKAKLSEMSMGKPVPAGSGAGPVMIPPAPPIILGPPIPVKPERRPRLFRRG